MAPSGLFNLVLCPYQRLGAYKKEVCPQQNREQMLSESKIIYLSSSINGYACSSNVSRIVSEESTKNEYSVNA